MIVEMSPLIVQLCYRSYLCKEGIHVIGGSGRDVAHLDSDWRRELLLLLLRLLVLGLLSKLLLVVVLVLLLLTAILLLAILLLAVLLLSILLLGLILLLTVLLLTILLLLAVGIEIEQASQGLLLG